MRMGVAMGGFYEFFCVDHFRVSVRISPYRRCIYIFT